MAEGATDMGVDLEEAYRQFGRALGETPMETRKAFQEKMGIQQPAQSRKPSKAQDRCLPAQLHTCSLTMLYIASAS